jgi:hypothetical protein
MALTKGNQTLSTPTPAGSTYSFSHNQNAGSDRFLTLTINSPAISVSSVTYAGVAMTLVRQESTTFTSFWSVWRLASPATGNNTISVTLSSGSWNPISNVANSFTDCAGVGNTAYNGSATNPVSTSVTISANSMIMGTVYAGTSVSAYIEIPNGSSRALEYTQLAGNWNFGAISPSLTAGSKTCSAGSTASNIIMLTEIKEVVSVPTNTQGMLMMF